MDCPAIEVFSQLVAGQLAPDRRARVADHAASCRTCHDLLAALVTQHGRVQYYGNDSLSIGGVIAGRFRIDDIVGVGGMGIVVAATHLDLRSKVAIKLLRDELLDSPAIIERFMREARAAAQLSTDHVCKVFDVARLTTGAPYIVMELLQGTDLLRAILQKPLALTIAVEYVMQACVALAEAHAAGIIHRDLKPANLFLIRRPDGRPLIKVLDFGVATPGQSGDARVTHRRALLGSPGYMSPEQLEDPRNVDARTDIWALGVTLYQLLSARMPFAAATPTELALRIASASPPPLEVPPALAAVIARCLARSADRRYPDVRSLVADLVPFGGPAARRLAASVGELARAPIALVAEVPPGLAYATTAPAPQPQRPPPVSIEPAGIEPAATPSAPVRPARTWLWIALAAIVTGNAIAVVALTRRGQSGAGAPAAPPSLTAGPATAPPASPPGATAAPAGAPVAAALPVVAIPDALTAEDIVAGLRQLEPRFQVCATSHDIHGKVIATFRVSPAGAITSVTLAEAAPSEPRDGFAACLAEASRGAKLPDSRTGGALRTPLVFH